MIRYFAACIAFFALTASAGAADSHGFRVEDPQGALSADTQAALDAQLQIVESVGLPQAVLDKMRETPIVIDPSLRGQPGVFAPRNGGVVLVRPFAFPANKPILLHELLHAWDFKVLGMRDPTVGAAWRDAKANAGFPAQYQSSHFLENAREFFAVTGTLYLFGDIQQPPFACASLAKLPPGYLDFLAAQFGPHSCKA